MNWDAIGAVGEIIGAFAVVLSLVYLALQIRTQNRETRIAAMHNISVGYRDTLATMADRDMAEIIDKAIEDYDALTRVESLRIIAWASRIFRVWEEAYLLFEADQLDHRIWDTIVRQFNGYMAVRPFNEVWIIRKQYFDEEFGTSSMILNAKNIYSNSRDRSGRMVAIPSGGRGLQGSDGELVPFMALCFDS